MQVPQPEPCWLPTRMVVHLRMSECPVLVTIVHHLSPFVAKALGRTFPGALLTLGAEILQPEIDRFVDGHGQVSRHDRCLEPGSHEW